VNERPDADRHAENADALDGRSGQRTSRTWQRRHPLGGALDRLDELEEDGIDEEQLRRLRELYRRRLHAIEAVLDGESPDEAERETRLVSYGALRRELIAVERETLLELRARGRLSWRTLRVIQRDLDLEDARVRV
jgi:monovalent cation/hydrogen antiporter